MMAFTARIGSVLGDDVLDITPSGGPDGLPFAPSWDLLNMILASRKRQRALFIVGSSRGREELTEQARELESVTWGLYVPRYLSEMRASYRHNRAAWDALLARERVCLVCYCTNAERCHRTLLARDILPKLGATFEGEMAGRRKGK